MNLRSENAVVYTKSIRMAIWIIIDDDQYSVLYYKCLFAFRNSNQSALIPDTFLKLLGWSKYELGLYSIFF